MGKSGKLTQGGRGRRQTANSGGDALTRVPSRLANKTKQDFDQCGRARRGEGFQLTTRSDKFESVHRKGMKQPISVPIYLRPMFHPITLETDGWRRRSTHLYLMTDNCSVHTTSSIIMQHRDTTSLHYHYSPPQKPLLVRW